MRTRAQNPYASGMSSQYAPVGRMTTTVTSTTPATVRAAFSLTGLGNENTSCTGFQSTVVPVDTPGFQRIGHGGASALAPANTPASFDAAVRIGIDMIEFDVRHGQGDLVLAHTIFHGRRGRAVRLGDALEHLSGPGFDGVALNVDVKHTGMERALIDDLRAAGLLHRALLSSQVPVVLDRLRDREPLVRLGISVGGRLARASRRWRDWRTGVLAGLAGGRWDAVMAQHRLVDERLIADIGEAGGRCYAWTVNDRTAITRLRALGVDGITTADPRLFLDD